jgi:biopolymer transport protein ExbB
MDFIHRAGPFLWPIVLCSVVGLAIFLERAFVLLRQRSSRGSLVEEVVELVRKREMDEAARVCDHDGGSSLGRVLATLLRAIELPQEERDQVVAVSGHRELRRMERGLRGIAVIARIAPLLGLLGTVVGLVQAFIAVSSMKGPPEPSVLANGIWQALLTTVAGLMVAIPAIISHEWLQSRVDEMSFGMEEAVTAVLAAAAATEAPKERDDRVPTRPEAASGR